MIENYNDEELNIMEDEQLMSQFVIAGDEHLHNINQMLVESFASLRDDV